MCEYCNLREIGYGEMSNENEVVSKLIDGSYVSTLQLNRYKVDDDNTNYHELILSTSVRYDDGNEFTVKEKHIDIKYCPFCGEKL